MSEETFTIESLVESNGILQDEVSQLRNSNRILRTVHRALRSANESLRRQMEQAVINDETFKQFCAGEFDAPNQFGEIVSERMQGVDCPECEANVPHKHKKFGAVVEVPTAEGALPKAEGQAESTV